MCIFNEALRDILCRADCVTGFPGGCCRRSTANNYTITIVIAEFSSEARLPGMSCTG